MTNLDRIVLHPDDNVAISLSVSAVARGHKIATRVIAAGDFVRRYGQIIGRATDDIAEGAHVHDHNVEQLGATPTAGAELGLAGVAHGRSLAPPARATFMGYQRPNGQVGTRNFLLIVPTVNCSATVAAHAAAALEANGLPDGVDGVMALTHQQGCGQTSGTSGQQILSQTLQGYQTNPNVGASLVVSLGCEANQPTIPIKRRDGSTVTVGSSAATTVTIQEAGGTRASIARLVAAGEELLTEIAAPRVEVSAGELVLALQCGGSDGFSGITANPALGVAVDLLVDLGGTALLGETPEAFGAEHLLIDRCTSQRDRDRIMELMAWWFEYAASDGVTLDANPTPGNRQGGITTIAEKSLGAMAKLGSRPISAVIDYAQRAPRGAVFMDSPGFDPVSVTGMIASGANIAAFTTGRGSVFGSRPAPCIKVSTTSELARSLPDDIDVDAGTVLTGESVESVGRRIFDLLLDVASGTESSSERLGFGLQEFCPWPRGAVL